VESQNHPIIIDDGGYDFHDQFHDIYPTNVFIDHEMRVHAILDTMHTAASVNVKIQEMLDNMPDDVYGCPDPDACNYNPNVTIDDGSCEYYDCAGECGGSSVEDECGVCNGDNSSCKDCNGDINGDAYIDGCEDCVGGNTGEDGCPVDCAGITNGGALLDNCGTCDNDLANDCIRDCAGEWGGTAIDDCASICAGVALNDECNICNDPVCNNLGTPSPFTAGENPCQLDGEYPISTLWNSTCDFLSLNNISIPNYFKISNLYPNPFNPVLNITFDIAIPGITKVNILDIYGSYIETLHSGFLQSGSHEMSWNAESMPSGVYFISLKLGNKNLTEKVVLLK